MLNGKTVIWHPGDDDQGNLLGTARTLDQEDGTELRSPMGKGLLSRDGWSVVDDSNSPLFTSDDFSFPRGESSPWPWVVRRTPCDRQDWYFFGYGHDYKQALEDFRSVSGAIPLPPRWSLGAMWTRYWPYTDRDLLDLVRQFHDENVPLDALVIDMDWHLSQFQLKARGEHDQSELRSLGWDGYTWNRSLFPYPKDFLDEIHRDGLRISLNLHPANGVQTWEESYPAMARAMGIDPATKKYVPFDILSQKFARNYMDILHHPLEKMGVDFWWIDWQQANAVKTPGVDSTFWLNYVHFTDQQREGKRPLLFGRWGGLGNHRYEMGFSGDVRTSWNSLAFQPYFTATAANVGFAYWNHDIGGHVPGPVDPELYTRWVQWGVFSPAFRIHTAPSVYADRRIWAYPEPYSDVMRAAFKLRYAMLPYIYTEARRTYDTGVAFLRPLYYEWPEYDAAYRYRDEYLFGDNMIVAPVVSPADATTKLAEEKLWIPAGDWVEMSSGKHFKGPIEVMRQYQINQIPILLRAGTILPEAPEMLRSDAHAVDPLILNITPMEDGAHSSYQLYADGDDGEKYQRGEDAWTTLHAARAGARMEIRIERETGSYPDMPKERGYRIVLPGDWPPARVSVNGKQVEYRPFGKGAGWRYDGSQLATVIDTPRFDVRSAVTVIVDRDPALESQRWKLDGLAGAVESYHAAQTVMTDELPVAHPPDSLSSAAEFAMRVTYHPETIAGEINGLLASGPQIAADVAQAQIHAPDAVHKAVLRVTPDEHSPLFARREAEFAARADEVTALIKQAQEELPKQQAR